MNRTTWINQINKQFNPNDDFFNFVNYNWIKENPIPNDMTRWGLFNILDENNKEKIKEILKMDSINKNIKILHQGYQDKTGKDSLMKLIRKVYEIKTLDEFNEVNYDLMLKQLNNSPVDFYVYANLNDSENNILYGSTGGLSLPDRDYYLMDNMKEKADKYKDFMSEMLNLFEEESKIKINKDNIYNFEKMIAKWTFTKVMKRDPKYYNNPMKKSEFIKKYPNINLNKLLDKTLNTTLSEKDFEMNISNPELFNKYNNFLVESNLNILKDHLLWSLLMKMSLVDKKYEDKKFNFYGKYLSGSKELKPMWKRAIDYTNSQLGELLGMEFCRLHFDIESKKKCMKMVKYIIDELGDRLNNNDWMDNETKKKAIVKLNKIRVKIGYPEKEGLRNFDNLKLDENESFFENHCKMNNFDTLFNFSELGKKKNKERFHMYPHMVNAYYSPVSNEIVFPAGILQYPFFDKDLDMAENFGAIGAVIGHEITHGFDDQGRKYDGNGNLNEWWSPQVLEKYQEKTNKIRDLFSNFKVNEKNVNGELTLGENIADLGGLNISYHAYNRYVKENGTEKVIDGFTPKERFFLSFGRVWRSHMRDEEKEVRLMTDPHSPPEFRVNGTLMNMEEFYEIFKVVPGNKLYLDKVYRGSVW